MSGDLFAASHPGACEAIGAATFLLRAYVVEKTDELLTAVDDVIRQRPFRRLRTPGGGQMSVGLANCGQWGWTCDALGYRYVERDPESGQPWPRMPTVIRDLGVRAAAQAGFLDFSPDACLLNDYRPGSKMGLHQDRDERDLTAPVVSVSLGMSAVFLLGGLSRSDQVSRLTLHHGDVLVWGGVDRLRYHGVLGLDGPPHPSLGARRLNFTLRKAAGN